MSGSGLNYNLMKYLRVFFLLGAVFPIVNIVRNYAVRCLNVVGVGLVNKFILNGKTSV